jgi:hypothetical protein
MNGIKCDECVTGYEVGDLNDCAESLGEFCDICITKMVVEFYF